MSVIGTKRTFCLARLMSASDPKRTFATAASGLHQITSASGSSAKFRECRSMFPFEVKLPKCYCPATKPHGGRQTLNPTSSAATRPADVSLGVKNRH
jgi:hypothetical protein